MISTSAALPLSHLKISLHWSLIRMEWYTFKFPFIFSSRLEGGTCKSIRFCELFSILNFRLEISWSSVGKSFTRSPSHIFLVIFEPKETIILSSGVTYVKSKYFVLDVQMFEKQCGITFMYKTWPDQEGLVNEERMPSPTCSHCPPLQMQISKRMLKRIAPCGPCFIHFVSSCALGRDLAFILFRASAVFRSFILSQSL